MTVTQAILLAACGVLTGVGASFTGLGGGFLVVPLLLLLGNSAPKAVGTSFLAILVISISALLAHQKLAHVEWRVGLLLGVGGAVGAQVGSRLIEHVTTGQFRRIFAVILAALAVYIFVKK